MTFYISGTTDVGLKKQINQDSFMVRKMETSIGQVVFACVCDGMGGLQSGELASATVLCGFRNWVAEQLPYLTKSPIKRGDIVSSWTHITEEYNNKILTYGQREGISLGTTLTAALFCENEYFIANIGDTRAYEITDTLVQLTHDHTYVQQEVDCGRMTPEEALVSKKRHILTQCIGARPAVTPDFFFGEVKSNAVYLLCSDGFRHEVSENEIISGFNPDSLHAEQELKAREQYLIELNKQRREKDNITAVTVMAK